MSTINTKNACFSLKKVLRLLAFNKKLGEFMDFHLIGVISGVFFGIFIGYIVLFRNREIE